MFGVKGKTTMGHFQNEGLAFFLLLHGFNALSMMKGKKLELETQEGLSCYSAHFVAARD